MASASPSELASIPLFASLPDGERAETAACFEVRDVDVGVRLVSEGTTGLSFFVIIQGSVAVAAGDDRVAELGPGDFFGEMALLDPGRRRATVTTTAPTRVLVLVGDDFQRLRSRHPEIASQIEDAMRRRLEALGAGDPPRH